MRVLRRGPFLWTSMTALIAFILGYAGYRSSLGDGLDRVDAVYRTMQLYAMDSDLSPDPPWTLRLARFLAPLSLATAAVVAASIFLRDHVQRALIAARARGHVVVVGLSSSAGAVAGAMISSGQRVVVIERDAQHHLLPGLRELGALVVIGDASQAVVLRRARAERAEHVIITTGDDGSNLDVAQQVRSVRDVATRGRATVHVAIDDPGLWLEIGRLVFGHGSERTAIECFNRHDRTGRHVVDRAAVLGIPDRVALIGSGPEADRIHAHLVRRSRLSSKALKIEAEMSHDIRLAIVSDVGGRVGDALSFARTYRSAHVVIAVDLENDRTLTDLLGPLARRITFVPTTPARLAENLLRDSAVEVMAQARHEDYLEQERAKGVTAAENPSLVPWDALPESLRTSNRRFAESVAGTLTVMGGTLEPLREGEAPDLTFSSDQLEDLAKREHDRWEADLRADGWVHRDAPKDPMAKTHALLVPWHELSEADREKDRDAIRAIPRMLARVGYELSVPVSG